MVADYTEAVVQVLFSYPDKTIDALTECLDEELDYIFHVFDRKTRYSLLAEELVDVLNSDTQSASCLNAIVRIFLRHGIKTIKIPKDFGAMSWGECYRGYVKLGPLFVHLGEGQHYYTEEDEIVNAAESLCHLRLSSF